MKDIYQSFEFDLIKKKIEKYARGEMALEKIRKYGRIKDGWSRNTFLYL